MAKYPIESGPRVPAASTKVTVRRQPPPYPGTPSPMNKKAPEVVQQANRNRSVKDLETERELRKQEKALTKLEYLAVAVILFNLVYGITIGITTDGFSRLFWNLPVFFIPYALSLICALFAMRDGKASLLYPVMVMTIPICIVGVAIWCFYVANGFYCSFTRHAESPLHRFHSFLTTREEGSSILPGTEMNVAVKENFLSCSIAPMVVDNELGVTIHPSDMLAACLFLLLAVEKIGELLLFRYLFKTMLCRNQSLADAKIMDEVLIVNSAPSTSSSTAKIGGGSVNKKAGGEAVDEEGMSQIVDKQTPQTPPRAKPKAPLPIDASGRRKIV